ncbi:DoxX family protein [Streptomyces sp. NPDC048288]|uniref:DoxX family protein n=1 Tax=Streptomyces sp. NPDC048288 TaxID=3365529 RepID=UPI00372088D1
MNITLWVVAALLALVFLRAGTVKLTKSKEQFLASGPTMAWGIGLVLPPAVDVATILVPLSASGLALVMIGAVIEHGRRKEFQSTVVNLVLLVLAAFVAWGRFGPHSF